MGFVGNLVLLPEWKSFENLLRVDKLIAMSLVYYFFGDIVFTLMWDDTSLKIIGDGDHGLS